MKTGIGTGERSELEFRMKRLHSYWRVFLAYSLLTLLFTPYFPCIEISDIFKSVNR